MSQSSFLMTSTLVATGGAFGSWLRYVVGLGWTAALGPVRAGSFPYGTLTVNILGSLLMGLLAGWLMRSAAPSDSIRHLLAVGLLGGFTTFSSFSLDAITLIERGEVGTSALYIGLTLAAGFASLFLGLILMRSVA